MGSIPTLPPIIKRYQARSRYSRSGSDRWPTQKRYTHPLHNTSFDVYPLNEQKGFGSTAAARLGNESSGHALDDSETTRYSNEEVEAGKGIQKTTEVNVKYERK